MSSALRLFLYTSPLLLSAATLAASLTSGRHSPVTATPATASPKSEDLAITIANWDRLRQSDSLAFADYAEFLLAHPGWPGETRMRRTAETRLDAIPATAAPAAIVTFFSRFEPLTPTGRARHAEALAATGHDFEARIAARTAWRSGALPPDAEARILARFGNGFTPADHDARMERLLATGATSAAQRQLTLASAARRPLFEARIALQTRRPEAAMLADGVAALGRTDPGFVLDRARWLQDNGQVAQARALLAEPVAFSAPAADPARWIDSLLGFARGADRDGQFSLAQGIALAVDRALSPTLDIRRQPLALRDDYTNLMWLGAQAAQRGLGRPADAIALYDRFARAAQTPQTRTKGWYWAGRAALAAGDTGRAQGYFATAAEHCDQFYGQLAAERLGRTTVLAGLPRVAPTGAERASFESGELVRVARMLGTMGRWQDQTQFLRAIAQQVESEAEHVLAAELSRTIGRPDLAVMTARNWRYSNGTEAIRLGFPSLALDPLHQPQWTMIHAIARQESQFDRQIVSHAGARGLMQLMPETARETATRLGLPYDADRLTADPAYNVMLGSAFFARMLDSFGGNHVLAIAAYNAGPGNVRKWLRNIGDPREPGADVIAWIERIPLSETRGYVQRVLENAVIYDALNPTGATMPERNRLSAYLGKNTPG